MSADVVRRLPGSITTVIRLAVAKLPRVGDPTGRPPHYRLTVRSSGRVFHLFGTDAKTNQGIVCAGAELDEDRAAETYFETGHRFGLLRARSGDTWALLRFDEIEPRPEADGEPCIPGGAVAEVSLERLEHGGRWISTAHAAAPLGGA